MQLLHFISTPFSDEAALINLVADQTGPLANYLHLF